MYSNEPIKFHKNRRGSPDIIIKWLDIVSVITWFLLLFDISLILYARPGEANFFDRLFNVNVRDYWDSRHLNSALVISVILFILSIFSIILNTRRLKRKDDRIRLSLIISAVFSLVFIIILIITIT